MLISKALSKKTPVLLQARSLCYSEMLISCFQDSLLLLMKS